VDPVELLVLEEGSLFGVLLEGGLDELELGLEV